MQASSTQNNKDSAGRRLGIKVLGNQIAYPGDIIARQRGMRWKPGKNTFMGRDHTIHAKVEGLVNFERSIWRKKKLIFINVIPQENPNRLRKAPPPHCYHPELYPELALKNQPFTNFDERKKLPIQKEKKQWSGVKCDTTVGFRREIMIPNSYLNLSKNLERSLSVSEQSLQLIKKIDEGLSSSKSVIN